MIAEGTVGWGDDGAHYDLGTGDNDGLTIVKVTLYQGRNPLGTIKAGEAQGSKVLCRLSGGLFRIPKKGTRVHVSFVDGHEGLPGAGVIIATIEKNPTIQFGADRAVLDFGDDVHVVIKGKSVMLSDYHSPARWIGVGTSRGGGPAGLFLQDETGSGMCISAGAAGMFSASGGDAKSVVQLTAAGITILHKTGGVLKMNGTESSWTAKKPLTLAGTSTKLGSSADPTKYAAVLATLPSATPPLTISTSVLVAVPA